jgi:hypothetical protein
MNKAETSYQKISDAMTNKINNLIPGERLIYNIKVDGAYVNGLVLRNDTFVVTQDRKALNSNGTYDYDYYVNRISIKAAAALQRLEEGPELGEMARKSGVRAFLNGVN